MTKQKPFLNHESFKDYLMQAFAYATPATLESENNV
jgi:hypothetical protein